MFAALELKLRLGHLIAQLAKELINPVKALVLLVLRCPFVIV